MGIIFSFTFYFLWGADADETKMYTFSSATFFDVILPLIIYNAGFNMRRKRFFVELGNQLLFGLFVTLVCFVLYSLLSGLSLAFFDIKMTKYVRSDNVSDYILPVQMSNIKLLIFSALLCSSDTVAAVSIVDFKSQPKLFSCILGEGVFNDIVAITLYIAILSLQGKEFSLDTLWLLTEQFVIVGLISIVIGAFFGFMSTLAFKSLRFLTRKVIIETFLMFATGMLSYFMAAFIEIKGI